MSERLIDANELKEATLKRRGLSWESMKNLFCITAEELDNAPTVEANSIIDGLNNEIDDLSENLAWYINERNRLLKERRQQGEWIEKLDYNRDTYYDCSVCGNSWTTIEGTPWDNGMNFCPNCGAKMLKGGDSDEPNNNSN